MLTVDAIYAEKRSPHHGPSKPGRGDVDKDPERQTDRVQIGNRFKYSALIVIGEDILVGEMHYAVVINERAVNHSTMGRA